MTKSLAMHHSGHPLWLAGFRPFFALACLAGASLPLAWVLMLSGVLPMPSSLARPALQWHSHEMFFGFGWAMLGGFLLTSTKNWVGIRGYHGGTLMFLAAAWLFDRAGMVLARPGRRSCSGYRTPCFSPPLLRC